MSIINTSGVDDGQYDGQSEGQDEPVIIPTAPHIQTSTSGWRIAADGDHSATFDYGEAGEVVINGRRYIAYVDLPTEEADEVFSEFEYWLYEATPIDMEPIDMEFEDEDGEGDGDAVVESTPKGEGE